MGYASTTKKNAYMRRSYNTVQERKMRVLCEALQSYRQTICNDDTLLNTVDGLYKEYQQKKENLECKMIQDTLTIHPPENVTA